MEVRYFPVSVHVDPRSIFKVFTRLPLSSEGSHTTDAPTPILEEHGCAPRPASDAGRLRLVFLVVDHRDLASRRQQQQRHCQLRSQLISRAAKVQSGDQRGALCFRHGYSRPSGRRRRPRHVFCGTWWDAKGECNTTSPLVCLALPSEVITKSQIAHCPPSMSHIRRN